MSVRQQNEAFEPFPRGTGKAEALLARMKECHEELAELGDLEEEDHSDYLDEMAAALLSPNVLRCKNNSVRMYLGCCLADVLVVYSPKSPYSNNEVKVVFNFLIERLGGLAQKQSSFAYEKSLYILNALVKVGSIWLLVNSRDEPGDEFSGEELVLRFIETIFDVLIPGRADNVDDLALELLETLFAEVDCYSPRLLDAVLTHLIGERATESPRAYNLARELIKSLADRLREPISALLSSVISGVSSDLSRKSKLGGGRGRRTNKKARTTLDSIDSLNDLESCDAESEEEGDAEDFAEEPDERASRFGARGGLGEEMMELKENLHELVYQLFLIEPGLLLTVLPQLAMQLEVDDLDIRTQAVDVFGRIFSSPVPLSFISENHRLMSSFLRRIHDVDVNIRLSLVKFAGLVLNAPHGGTDGQINRDTNEGKETSVDNGEQDEGGGGGEEKEKEKADSSAEDYPLNTEELDEEADARSRFWAKPIIGPSFLAHHGKTVAVVPSKSDSKPGPSFLELALDDKESSVRREAVEVCSDLLVRPGVLQLFQETKINDLLLRSLALRLADRKIDIATSALGCLAQCLTDGLVEPYWHSRALISLQQATGGEPASQKTQVSDSMSEDDLSEVEQAAVEDEDESALMTVPERYAEQTLGWIPSELAKQNTQQRPHEELLELQHALCKAIDGVVFRKSRLCEPGTSAFVLVIWWEHLCEVGQKAFSRLFIELPARLAHLVAKAGTLHEDWLSSQKATRTSLGANKLFHRSASASKRRRSSRRAVVTDDENDESSASTGPEQDTDKLSSSHMEQGKRILVQVYKEFIPRSRCPDGAQAMEKIWDNKDRSIMRKLVALFSGKESLKTESELMADVVGRLGHRSEQSKMVRLLFDRYVHKILPESELLTVLSTVLRARILSRREKRVLSTCALVSHSIASPKPSVASAAPRLQSAKWLLELVFEKLGKKRRGGNRSSSSSTSSLSKEETDTFQVSLGSLHALCRLGCTLIRSATQGARDGSNDIIPLLEDMVTLSEDVPCVRACTKAFWSLVRAKQEEGDTLHAESFGTLARKITSVIIKSLDNPKQNVACPLAALSILLKRNPAGCSDPDVEATRAAAVALERIRRPYRGSVSNREKELAAKQQGIKVVCYDILRKLKTQWSNSSADIDSVKKQLLLLRKIVADHGDPWSGENLRKKRKSQIQLETTGDENSENTENAENTAVNGGAEGNNNTASEAQNKKESLHSHGQLVDSVHWPPPDASHIAGLRLAAGCALVTLESHIPASLKHVLAEGRADQSELREIQRWVELSWLAMDTTPSVREHFLDKVYRHFLTKGRELFRFGAFFALSSSLDESRSRPSEISIRYKNLLSFLNKQVEARRLVASAREGAMQLAPECILPTVVYLLSHHPVVPQEQAALHKFISSAAGQRVVVKPLVHLIDSLSAISKTHNANAGLLYALLEVMRRHYDALSPKNELCYMLGEICYMLIKSRMKVSPDTLEYPGKVVLPKVFIKSQGAHPSPKSGMPSPGLSPIGKQRRSLSPRQQSSLIEKSPTTYLPDGFELRIGGSASASTLATGVVPAVSTSSSATTPVKRRGKKTPKTPTSSPSPRAAPVVTPTRRQPTRTRSAPKYLEVDSDAE